MTAADARYQTYPPEVAARANALMRAYLNGRLQVGLDWPEWDEYWEVYRLALRQAARIAGDIPGLPA